MPQKLGLVHPLCRRLLQNGSSTPFFESRLGPIPWCLTLVSFALAESAITTSAGRPSIKGLAWQLLPARAGVLLSALSGHDLNPSGFRPCRRSRVEMPGHLCVYPRHERS